MSPKPAVLSLFFAAFLFTATSAGATDTLSVIHKFLGGSDGDDPSAMIQASDGNFYGTTYLSVGTVFKVTPDGQFTTLFVATHNSNRYFYGDFFTSVVEGPDGFLYVISRGSNSNPNPTLFRISKSGTDYQVVLEEAPNSLSVASDGNFYGADGNGIFRLTTGGTYTVCFHIAMTCHRSSRTTTVMMPAALPRLNTLFMALSHPFPRGRRPEDDLVLERKVEQVEEIPQDAGQDDRRVHGRQTVRLFHLRDVEPDAAVAGDQLGRNRND